MLQVLKITIERACFTHTHTHTQISPYNHSDLAHWSELDGNPQNQTNDEHTKQ
jgi:hypothetical protein